MISLVPTQRLLLFLALATSACAYSNHLWHVDFDTFRKWRIIQEEEECWEAYGTLNKLPYNSNSTALVNCILGKTDEVTKSEFGVVAVMLGLLPGVLQLIGPKFSDLAILATWRPMPSSGLRDYGHGVPSRQGLAAFLARLAEDATAMVEPCKFSPRILRGYGCRWNCGVSFLPPYILCRRLDQHPDGAVWRYARSLFAAALGLHWYPYTQSWRPATTFVPRSFSRRCCIDTPAEQTTLFSLLQNELTPCAFATDIGSDGIKLQNGPIYQILNWLIRLCIWADVIYGIIVLSTILFVPMWSAIWMIGLVFTGTLVCRLVLAFEMHGLREVPKVYGKASEGSMEAGYEMARLMPENGKAPSQEYTLPLLHR